MIDTAIIIGAPRSGTNMLRDVLASVDGIETWPCDEINLIWRHGNLDIPHDEIPPERATAHVRGYLRETFERFRRRSGAQIVLEKTCASSLRVPFVLEVFPSAKYIFIQRDGIDAAASTMKRWNAEFDWRYTARKARYVPPSDVPRHLWTYGGKQVVQRLRGDHGREDHDLRVSTWWGPKPHDYRELQAAHALEELAFIQWQRSIEQSAAALSVLPEEQLFSIEYADYVSDPRRVTAALLTFLGMPAAVPHQAIARVSTSSVGKGRGQLGPDAVRRLARLGGDTLSRFGYA